MLAAIGIAAMGLASGFGTTCMNIGITGIMLGLGVRATVLAEERRVSGLRTGPLQGIMLGRVSRASTLVLAAKVLVLQFGICRGLVLAAYQRDVVAIIVCAAAALVLGRVFVPRMSESVDAVRAMYDRRYS